MTVIIRGVENLVKFYVRSVSRVLTPWYWI